MYFATASKVELRAHHSVRPWCGQDMSHRHTYLPRGVPDRVLFEAMRLNGHPAGWGWLQLIGCGLNEMNNNLVIMPAPGSPFGTEFGGADERSRWDGFKHGAAEGQRFGLLGLLAGGLKGLISPGRKTLDEFPGGGHRRARQRPAGRPPRAGERCPAPPAQPPRGVGAVMSLCIFLPGWLWAWW